MNFIVKVLRKPEVSELAGEKVMIDFESGKYYMLKGVANDIWDLLTDGITSQSIVNSLLKEYDVDSSTCLASVNDFLNALSERGFISLT